MGDQGLFFPTLALALGACLPEGWNFLLSMLTTHLSKSSPACDSGNESVWRFCCLHIMPLLKRGCDGEVLALNMGKIR